MKPYEKVRLGKFLADKRITPGFNRGFNEGYQLAMDLLVKNEFKGESKHFAAWLYEMRDAFDWPEEKEAIK